MTRPHEDRERHTPADHRTGGVPIRFEPGAWCAIDIAHVKAERVDAGIAAYETLIEKARTSSVHARVATVLRSVDDRRVITLIEIEGHEAFAHLESAWDDHHLFAERHAVAESSLLALYRLAEIVGDLSIDPETKDAYLFEHRPQGSEHARAAVAAVAGLEGFRGALVFGSDDAKASVLVYRLTRIESPAAQRILGPVRADTDAASAVHPVRTFG
jgi:hypothetical protein